MFALTLPGPPFLHGWSVLTADIRNPSHPHPDHSTAMESSHICNHGALSLSGCVYGTYMDAGPSSTCLAYLSLHISANSPVATGAPARTPSTFTTKRGEKKAKNETSGHGYQKRQPPRHLTFIDVYDRLLNKWCHCGIPVQSRPSFLTISVILRLKKQNKEQSTETCV